MLAALACFLGGFLRRCDLTRGAPAWLSGYLFLKFEESARTPRPSRSQLMAASGRRWVKMLALPSPAKPPELTSPANAMKKPQTPPQSHLRSLALLLAMSVCPELSGADELGLTSIVTEPQALILDHAIERIDRIEFYRLSDFGPPDSACHPCLSPQHIKCNTACYGSRPSLSLICSAKVKGLSIGPFTRAERWQILEELFKTDQVYFMTSAGEEVLEAPRVTSSTGEDDSDYAIDIEGFEGLKNTLVRASAAPEQFKVKIGPATYEVPLGEKTKDGLYRFLKQCPG